VYANDSSPLFRRPTIPKVCYSHYPKPNHKADPNPKPNLNLNPNLNPNVSTVTRI